MGRKGPAKGVYAREASILIDFKWRGKRFRERLDIPPTPKNMMYAANQKQEIDQKIALGTFDFAAYFPKSKTIAKLGLENADSPLFSEMVEEWLKLMLPELAETTYKEYKNTLYCHHVPKLGARRMNEFTLELVEKHVAGLGIDNNKTFNNVVSPLRGVLAKAFDWKKTSVDFGLIVPSRKKPKNAKPQPLDPDEIADLLAKLFERNGEQVANYFEFAIFTGMRPSELIALDWDDIDFRKRIAHVRRALVRTIEKDTKTGEEREVELSDRAFDALTRQKKFTYLQNGRVFHNPLTDAPYTDTQVQMEKFWRPTLRLCKIRHRDARQTRHTYATMCLMAGMNPAYVAGQMGHSVEMFFRVYSKWINKKANTGQQQLLNSYIDQIASQSSHKEGGK